MADFPVAGDTIYVPTIDENYIGGLAEVMGVHEGQVSVAEHDGARYDWKNWLQPLQKELEKTFGNRRAYHAGVL